MEFEVLKRSHLKRNIIIGVIAVLLISAVILNFTRAKYRTTAEVPIASGTINYSLADLNIVAITVDGESVETIPEGNYELTDESYCIVDGEDTQLTLNWDNETKALSVTPFTTKGTKCYLYFEEATTKTVDTPLGEVEVNLDQPDFSKTSCTSGCGEQTVGLYEETTSKGTTYYYRGDVNNNYVSFAGYYWRILRISEDGSIRMIYDGTSPHTNGQSSTNRQIQTSVYNSSYNRSYYVGYTYLSNAQRPSNPNSGTSSTIKGVLDNWYNTNLQQYDNIITNTPGFCNDREMANGSNWSSLPTNDIYYAAYDRILNNSTASLECSNSNDLYQTKIGLITADEVIHAGLNQSGSNAKFYLFTGTNYWTITPSYVQAVNTSVSWPNMFYVYSYGSLSYDRLENEYGVRPVINISSNATITGEGTMSNPYTIVS